MGLLTVVSKNGQNMEVIYPSESVLVHGAHRLYQIQENRIPSSAGIQLIYLIRMIQQGLMEGGQRGELVARFLLISSLRKAGLYNGI